MPGCAAGVVEEKSISAKKGFLSRLAILYGMLNFASFAPGRYMTLIPKPILCTTPLESEFPSPLIFYKHLTTLWSGFSVDVLGLTAKWGYNENQPARVILKEIPQSPHKFGFIGMT